MLVRKQSKGPRFVSISQCNLKSYDPSPSKRRTRLAAADVLMIFQAKTSCTPATAVGRAFGVNEKTVRDIWAGRTWAKETWQLDPSRCASPALTCQKTCQNAKPTQQNRRINNQPQIPKSGGDSAHQYSSNFIGRVIDCSEEDWKCFLIGTSSHFAEPCAAGETDIAAVFEDLSETSDHPLMTLDEQLYRWEGAYYDMRSSDPFKNDWKPPPSERT